MQRVRVGFRILDSTEIPSYNNHVTFAALLSVTFDTDHPDNESAERDARAILAEIFSGSIRMDSTLIRYD